MNRLKLLITVIDRGLGNEIDRAFEELGCHANCILLGKGTASQEILEYLGFGTTEKEVILSIVKEELVPDLFQLLEDEFDFDRPGKGVSCSIPLSSVAGQKVYEMIIQKKGETK